MLRSALALCLLSLAARAEPNQKTPARIDVAFALDTTGSMGDEIDVVKEKIVDIARRVASGQPKPDVRFGLVAYRDRGDAYLTKTFAFTRDLRALQRFVNGLDADGGGDEPEDVAQGLWVTVNELSWDLSPSTARIVFLIGDAGPHQYPDGKDWRRVASQAAERGIVVNPIGCSGLAAEGEKVFAAIAERTHGEMRHLTYRRAALDGRTLLEAGGKTYVAGRLDESEWKKGAEALIREGKAKEIAGGAVPAAAAPARNNLDEEISAGVIKAAQSRGVKY